MTTLSKAIVKTTMTLASLQEGADAIPAYLRKNGRFGGLGSGEKPTNFLRKEKIPIAGPAYLRKNGRFGGLRPGEQPRDFVGRKYNLKPMRKNEESDARRAIAEEQAKNADEALETLKDIQQILETFDDKLPDLEMEKVRLGLNQLPRIDQLSTNEEEIKAMEKEVEKIQNIMDRLLEDNARREFEVPCFDNYEEAVSKKFETDWDHRSKAVHKVLIESMYKDHVRKESARWQKKMRKDMMTDLESEMDLESEEMDLESEDEQGLTVLAQLKKSIQAIKDVLEKARTIGRV